VIGSALMSRFDRQERIPNWNQKLLTDAVVVVVGVGALGNEVARILVQSGVGTLVLCDHDVVEESNLCRSVLFRPNQIGKLKVHAAAHSLQEYSSEVQVDCRPTQLVHGVGLAELRDASLVVSCLDTRHARLQLSGRCQLVRARMLDAGTNPWGGEVRPFLDPNGPCYGCGLGDYARATSDHPWSCDDLVPVDVSPAATPSSALVGAWMGLLATRFLMGLSVPSMFLRIDGSTGTSSLVKQSRDPSCLLHSPLEKATLSRCSHLDTVGELRRELAEGERPYLWVPIDRTHICNRCGSESCVWGNVERRDCQKCGEKSIRTTTTLDFFDAPDTVVLKQIGIAPKEILAIHGARGIRMLELSVGKDKSTCG
jgi:molybdopterin/thiamine biosynthesis adenylyltransferase